MPYVSDKQRRFFHAAEARGEIKPATVKEFDEASRGLKLPKFAPKKRKRTSIRDYLSKQP